MRLSTRIWLSVLPVLLVVAWFWYYLRVPPDCDLSIDGPCNITMSIRLIQSIIGAVVFLVIWVVIFKIVQKKRNRTTHGPQSKSRLRRSARVFLFDEHGDVLLIRFHAQRSDGPYTCWVTPGGEVEPGETDRATAQRELFEELGIQPELAGPVHEASGGEYEHLGEVVRNFDVFFAAQCERLGPKLSGVTADEIALMQEARWWSAGELTTAAEPVFPEDIATVAAKAWERFLARNKPG